MCLGIASADVKCAALDPNPPDNGRAARAAPGESVAADDAERRALEASAIAEVALPADGHAVGEVACTGLEVA